MGNLKNDHICIFFSTIKEKGIFYEIIFSLVVAQMIEQSLSTPGVRGLNPISDINDKYPTKCDLEKTKIIEKEAGNGLCLIEEKRKGNRF